MDSTRKFFSDSGFNMQKFFGGGGGVGKGNYFVILCFNYPSGCDATSLIFCCIELCILIVRLSRSTSFSAHSPFKLYSRVKDLVKAVIYS